MPSDTYAIDLDLSGGFDPLQSVLTISRNSGSSCTEVNGTYRNMLWFLPQTDNLFVLTPAASDVNVHLLPMCLCLRPRLQLAAGNCAQCKDDAGDLLTSSWKYAHIDIGDCGTWDDTSGGDVPPRKAVFSLDGTCWTYLCPDYVSDPANCAFYMLVLSVSASGIGFMMTFRRPIALCCPLSSGATWILNWEGANDDLRAAWCRGAPVQVPLFSSTHCVSMSCTDVFTPPPFVTITPAS